MAGSLAGKRVTSLYVSKFPFGLNYKRASHSLFLFLQRAGWFGNVGSHVSPKSPDSTRHRVGVSLCGMSCEDTSWGGGVADSAGGSEPPPAVDRGCSDRRAPLAAAVEEFDSLLPLHLRLPTLPEQPPTGS